MLDYCVDCVMVLFGMSELMMNVEMFVSGLMNDMGVVCYCVVVVVVGVVEICCVDDGIWYLCLCELFGDYLICVIDCFVCGV